MSIAQQIVLRLTALRQASLGHTGGWAREWRRAWTDDLAVWAAWLQTHPDDLVAVLHLLTTEIAQTRRDAGFPILEVPTPVLPADPDLEIDGTGGHALLDRVGALLAGIPDWEIRLTLADRSTVTARPAGRSLTPERVAAGYPPAPTTPKPAEER